LQNASSLSPISAIAKSRTVDQRADVTRKTSDAAVIPIRHFSMASSNIVVMPARMAARSMTVASAPAPFEQVQTKLLYRTLWHRSRRALRCREPSTA
jgi:hypothetical protein